MSPVESSRQSLCHARMILICAVVGLAAIALVLAWPRSRKADDVVAAERLCAEATRLAGQSNLTEALKTVELAKEAAPRYGPAWLLSADLLERASKDEEALAELRAGHMLLQRDAAISLALLRHLPPYAPLSETEPLARQAIAQSPGSAMPRYFLARAIINSHNSARYAEAQAELRQAAGFAPRQTKIHLEMARLQILDNKESEAAASLETAMALTTANLRDGTTSPAASLEERRIAASWLVPVYAKLGREKEARDMKTLAARLSESLREIQTLQARASASPPDPNAATRLEGLMRALAASPGS